MAVLDQRDLCEFTLIPYNTVAGFSALATMLAKRGCATPTLLYFRGLACSSVAALFSITGVGLVMDSL